jgi:hypothetical protein
MQNKVTRFQVVKVSTTDFVENISKNAEIAALHQEGWSIIDVQPIEENGKQFWMAILSPPVSKGPYIIDPSSLIAAAPFIGLVAGITTGIINWMVG